MQLSASLNPSPRTWVRLSLATPIAGLISFWFYSANYDCGAQVWSCRGFVGLAIVSFAFGLALAATYTGLAVLLGAVVGKFRPAVKTLEPTSKVIPISLVMFAIQAAVIGFLNLAGVLPAAWPWWLGVFGAYAS